MTLGYILFAGIVAIIIMIGVWFHDFRSKPPF